MSGVEGNAGAKEPKVEIVEQPVGGGERPLSQVGSGDGIILKLFLRQNGTTPRTQTSPISGPIHNEEEPSQQLPLQQLLVEQ